jgi:tRNA-splicing ligase RtcB
MMRKDPYQDRARELCAAAGIDPESRVGQGRGRPAWCDYREAARVEKVAREQAALAATTKQNPDAPAPIVVGQHDENTVGQMKNCMSYGNVAAGVICADGHLGYAQPVGGVIAYRDQISVSGVGFDIACGNMAVKLDTKFEQIKDSVGTISFGLGRTNNASDQHNGCRFPPCRATLEPSTCNRLRIAGGTFMPSLPPASFKYLVAVEWPKPREPK